MSSSSRDIGQPVNATQLDLAQVRQELQQALHSLQQIPPGQPAQDDVIRTVEEAVQKAQQALEAAEAMLALEPRDLQVPEPGADVSATSDVPDDLTDQETREVLAAEERGEPTAPPDITLNEPSASTVHDELEAFEAKLERSSEDRPLLESDALQFVGTRAVTVDGDDLGEVQELVLGQNGVVQAVLVNTGGAGGLPERQIRIDWNDIEISADGRVVVNLSPEDLQQLPPA